MPYRILETLIALPILFMGLLMPLLRNAYSRGDIALFKRYMQKGFDGLSIVSLPMFFGTIVLAKPIIYLLGGKEFAASVPILRILIAAVSIMFMTSLFAHAVITINGQKKMIKFYVSIAVLMLALYLIFIPMYSYWAASILTVLSEFFALTFLFFAVYKKTAFVPNLRVFSKSVISAILMAGVIFFVRNVPLFAIVPFAVALYTAILYYIGGIKKEAIIEILKIKG
jgi:O-antigen/teichoic acid export membrane protein